MNYRPITTTEELDALPNRSVYMSSYGVVVEQKLGDVWFAAGVPSAFEPELPGIVLWTPDDPPSKP